MAFDIDPSQLGNPQDLEQLWVNKAIDFSEVHYDLLQSLDARFLKLTHIDDRIYEAFKASFPELNVEKIEEEELKNEAAKIKWRHFCEQFKPLIKDHNFGTLLRLDPKGPYTEENTTFSYRLQFLAIEIARNKEGFNLSLHTMPQQEFS
ncbi:protein PBDC1-like [Symsagittifera roscoffensis]|uniref:protein PBDC1-like n=1 Tax=Symsagittifera roscoffensis TaxID=84072 RepID=UPI00307B8A0D